MKCANKPSLVQGSSRAFRGASFAPEKAVLFLATRPVLTLSDMDEEIQALEQRLSKTRQIKQGMMQELLTGKTRLVQPQEPQWITITAKP
ncbi:hypothetical protein [Sessilibacter sp. MAH4]